MLTQDVQLNQMWMCQRCCQVYNEPCKPRLSYSVLLGLCIQWKLWTTGDSIGNIIKQFAFWLFFNFLKYLTTQYVEDTCNVVRIILSVYGSSALMPVDVKVGYGVSMRTNAAPLQPAYSWCWQSCRTKIVTWASPYWLAVLKEPWKVSVTFSKPQIQHTETAQDHTGLQYPRVCLEPDRCLNSWAVSRLCPGWEDIAQPTHHSLKPHVPKPRLWDWIGDCLFG